MVIPRCVLQATPFLLCRLVWTARDERKVFPKNLLATHESQSLRSWWWPVYGKMEMLWKSTFVWLFDFKHFKYLEIRCRFTHPGLAYRHVRIVVNFHHFVVDVINFNFHVFVCHSHGYSVDCLQPPSWMTRCCECCRRDAFCLVFKYLESHLWIVVVSSTVKFSSGHILWYL